MSRCEDQLETALDAAAADEDASCAALRAQAVFVRCTAALFAAVAPRCPTIVNEKAKVCMHCLASR